MHRWDAELAVGSTPEAIDPELASDGIDEYFELVIPRLVKRDKVDVITGMVFSNVLLPVMPTILNSDTVYISANTGPADYAGERCHPNFFSVSWQNEDIPAAMGKYVTDQAH